jgi:hypothetical protein
VGSKPKENSKYLISFVNLLFNYQTVETVPGKKTNWDYKDAKDLQDHRGINSKHEIHELILKINFENGTVFEI